MSGGTLRCSTLVGSSALQTSGYTVTACSSLSYQTITDREEIFFITLSPEVCQSERLHRVQGVLTKADQGIREQI